MSLLAQHRPRPVRCWFALAAVGALCACGEVATLPVAAGTGPSPMLPQPVPTLVPTVHIAPAQGWSGGRMPTPAAGLQVQAFAIGLDHPRWLYVLPNGDVLVAETNAPAKPEAVPSIRGWFMGLLMGKSGAGGASADRITLLRDTDGDGAADQRTVFLAQLHSPFGMALVGTDLYVANTDAVLRFPYTRGDTQIAVPGTKVVDLPAGPINHHWTKNLIASADGQQLYVTVGSNSNVGERGMDVEVGRAAIWQIDLRTQTPRMYASGLRNPNGLAWEPQTGALWTTVNERDEIGSDLVPDYLTQVHANAFYGWPYSYYGRVDTRVTPPRPDLLAQARLPDYALGPHTASLGLAAATGEGLLPAYAQGMFVGQHGSWNRRPHSGYKVVFIAFAQGKPVGMPLDVLTGFLSADGEAYGRPVGVVLDHKGGLLVADDVGNVVWRVSRAGSP